jgi:hypothetical protein
MSYYMSQIPPKPKPTAGPKRVKPKSPSSMDKDLREMREMPKRVKPKRDSMEARDPKRAMPKRIPKEVEKGIMGSTEVQAVARQKKALDDMRKRGMLKKAKKNK